MPKSVNARLTIFAPPPPPPAATDCEIATLKRLCSLLPGLPWLITFVMRAAMKFCNAPGCLVQSFNDWAATFQETLSRPENQKARETFLRLAAFNRCRRVCAVSAAYVNAQSVKVIEHFEVIYPSQLKNANSIDTSLRQMKKILDETRTSARRLSDSPGLWASYAEDVQGQLYRIGQSLTDIKTKRMRPRKRRKELLAGISLFTVRMILFFAGAPFKATKKELTDFNRRDGRLIQSILGRIEHQDEQPVIDWICIAQKASGVKTPRTAKALRDELDRSKVRTPLWLQVQEHVERMWD